jgi:hypothetical protein
MAVAGALCDPQSVGNLPRLRSCALIGGMAPRILTFLSGPNMPIIRQRSDSEPSTIKEKTIADFTRVVEQTGILKQPMPKPDTTDD